MTAHVQDELPGLLTGDADPATIEAVSRHLHECEQCRSDLAAVVSAYSAIASAKRFAPQLLESDLDMAAGEPLPDLAEMFARIESEAGPKPADSKRPAAVSPAPVALAPSRTRARRIGLIAAAVVLGAAAGVGGEYAVTHLTGSSPSTEVVQLAPFDQGHTPATAKIRGGDRIRLDATSLPSPGQTHYYEAWLTDAKRQHLYPLGPLGPDQTANYRIPSHFIDAYSAIEVSVQPADSNGSFSGVSVLRGSYR